MVRNIDDLDFCLPSHPQTVLDGLRTLRFNPKLSDVTLLVGGREFPCHRSVLALCSVYFNAMFTGNFVESISAQVEIKDVDPQMMEMLLDFAYSGKLTINQENVEGLIWTSNRLQFTSVRKVCSRYLQQQIDPTNCLGIYEFGETHGFMEVIAKARAFLLENFEAISQNEEFLQLTKEKLAAYLGDDKLRVRDLPSLLEAVLRWVGYEEVGRVTCLPELLELVHLPLLSADYLKSQVLTNTLIQASDACREMIESHQNKRGVTGDLVTPEASLQQNAASPHQKLQEVLVVVGGRALEEGDEDEEAEEPPVISRNSAFYNIRTKRWSVLPDFPDYNKWGFSIVALNNDVYVTGGSRGSKNDSWSTTQGWKFCSTEGQWQQIAPMMRPRTSHTTTVLNGEIYAIGGTSLDIVEVECYDPYSDSWSLISPTVKYVSNFTATGCLGKLYVIGSCTVKYNALTLQCYNPVIDGWSIITSPFIPKYLSAPRSVSLDGVIYLIGDNTKKVYVYDPEANMWQKVQLLQTLHENGGMVEIGGKIFVTGGHWKGMEGDYWVEMEVYDCAKDVWVVEGHLPRLWFYHGSCSIFIDTTKWTELFPLDQT
ncbi:kelch-like protein 30 [Latimeria chalumnae]|uniref:Kelch like family member 30 n=1 Tax=Latimeria chalumnae TaxID=7897 RepID=H3ATJ6_LATCH|nr:PREDICTED: kelch-like protein 30 [Latimeria chalumnae]XP_006003053.1 PREDICTED: kelch-like protein 30 [Latimeria chalumnae]|eukprot:XP_006003052.1 PREDICTED: kelch-like protein 30 [Latimeria chalumnae]